MFFRIASASRTALATSPGCEEPIMASIFASFSRNSQQLGIFGPCPRRRFGLGEDGGVEYHDDRKTKNLGGSRLARIVSDNRVRSQPFLGSCRPLKVVP